MWRYILFGCVKEVLHTHQIGYAEPELAGLLCLEKIPVYYKIEGCLSKMRSSMESDALSSLEGTTSKDESRKNIEVLQGFFLGFFTF